MTDETARERRHLATVELLGALTYGQLRAFQVTATAVACAPDARAADQLAGFAVREHQAYTMLRDQLVDATDLAAAVIDRQKAVLDEFFNAAPVATDWRDACAFFAVGLPIAADFTREVAPTLEPATAEVVVGALAERDAFEGFASRQLQDAMGSDEEIEQVRHLVADMLGRVLTGFQGAIADTDALQILLAEGAVADEDGNDVTAEARVRRVAVRVLDGHRRRMHALGIDVPE